jgi:hypothetical protein
MLVVVRAVWEVPEHSEPKDVCRSQSSVSTRSDTVLYWSESPANGEGKASDSWATTVKLDKTPKYYCAAALLIERLGEKNARASVSIIRADTLADQPQATTTDTPAAST